MLVLAALALSSAANLDPIMVAGELCHPRYLMVKVRSESDLNSLTQAGADLIRYMPQIKWAVVEAPVHRLLQTRSALESIRGIEQVTLDRAALPAYTPNDPMWTNQWDMRAMKVDLAWDTTLGTNAGIVAVIDTGVQMDHPDLAANIWTNPGEIASNGTDDDGNGYVDDLHGYDFVNNDGDPTDDQGHGTSCAGIVAAVGDNSTGISGCAPNARIMVLKAGNSGGYFYDSATVPAYLYGADNGARVFSMSYYADHVSPSEQDAMNYATAHNVLPIAAAGNDSTCYSYYPGAYENVVSVAALDTSLNKAGFSDFGSWVDVAAPGVSITTTARTSTYTTGFAGTSAACPHVAGVAALLIGANPGATAAKVRRILEDTATPVSQAPFGEYANYGMINAQAAMLSITGRIPPEKSSLVRWISPIGDVAVGKTALGEAYGRTLEQAEVQADGLPTTHAGRSREFVKFHLPNTGDSFSVLDGSGNVVGTFQAPVSGDYVYPLIEGAAPAAYCSGGYADTLLADSAYMRVTRQSDGTILLQATFRNLPVSGKVTLVIRRAYTSGGGTENVQLYNWASASYPYGQFDTFSSGPVSTSMTETHVVIDNIAPYVDFNKTAYLRIATNGADSGEELHLDQAYLRRGKHP